MVAAALLLSFFTLTFHQSSEAAFTCRNLLTHEHLALLPKTGNREPQKYIEMFEALIPKTEFKFPTWDHHQITQRASFYQNAELNSARLQEIVTGNYRGIKSHYLWTFTEGEVLRFMPELGLMKEIDGQLTESLSNGDEVSKHIILTQSRDVLGAGEFWFEQGGTKLIFDLASGTYMRQISFEERAIVTQILTKKFQLLFPEFEVEVRNFEFVEN